MGRNAFWKSAAMAFSAVLVLGNGSSDSARRFGFATSLSLFLFPTSLEASCRFRFAIALSVFLLLGGCSPAVDASKSRNRFGILSPKTKLTWVNGIGYNQGHMKIEAPVIARYFGGKPVDFYHNPTKMVDEADTRGYFSDLTQAGQQKYLGTITAEVNGLVEHLRKAVRSVASNDGIVIHIAHSQGALVTSLAAKQLTPLELNRIEVIAFGGGTPLRSTPETPFRRCVNYYSVNDPILFINPVVEQALRSGFYQDEFCFLAPRVGDPIADHMLLGPTYASALEWEGHRFERAYTTRLRRTIRWILLNALSVIAAMVQIVVGLVQKLAAFQSETRRALARSLVDGLQAFRTWILEVLARLLATMKGLVDQSPTTIATTTPEGTEGARLSVSKAPVVETEETTLQPKSRLGFRGTAPPLKLAAATADKVTTARILAVKARWMSPKKKGKLKEPPQKPLPPPVRRSQKVVESRITATKPQTSPVDISQNKIESPIAAVKASWLHPKNETQQPPVSLSQNKTVSGIVAMTTRWMPTQKKEQQAAAVSREATVSRIAAVKDRLMPSKSKKPPPSAGLQNTTVSRNKATKTRIPAKEEEQKAAVESEKDTVSFKDKVKKEAKDLFRRFT